MTEKEFLLQMINQKINIYISNIVIICRWFVKYLQDNNNYVKGNVLRFWCADLDPSTVLRDLIKVPRNTTTIKALLHCSIIAFILLPTAPTKAQSLQTILQQVTENNTELKSLQLQYEAELEKVAQEGQLPNPQVGVGLPISGAETRLGPQQLMVSASQMFPWFGTLKAKEDVVISMSKAKYERIAAIKLNLFYEVKKAYYQLYTLGEKEKIIREFIEIYMSIENVSLAKVESGQSTIADVLRIQLKIQSFKQNLVVLQNDKSALSARLNELANQEIDKELIIDDKLSEVAEIDYNLEEFKKRINEYHPLIVKLDKEIEASKGRQSINNNMGKPSLGLGLDYSMVGERADANPLDNGKDILVPKVMFSIPIYRKGYKAKDKEEMIKQTALDMDKETLSDKMMRILIQEKLAYDNAVSEIEYNHQQIKTTNTAYEVLLSNYSSSGKGFDDLLQVQNQLLSYQVNLLKEQLKTYLKRSSIERITDY